MSFDYSQIVTNRVKGQGAPASDNNVQGLAILDLDARQAETEEAVGKLPKSYASRNGITVNGGTNAYRADGNALTFDGGGGFSVAVSRRKVVIEVDGYFEGISWANVGGVLSPAALGEAAGFQNLTVSASFCFGTATSTGYAMFADSGAQEVVVVPGAKTVLRPKGGRVSVSKGDVIWLHLMLAGAAPTDAYFTTEYADRSDGEDYGWYTLANIGQARTKRNTFPWTSVNQASADPPFAKLPLPGPTEVFVTPFVPGPFLAVVGTSRAEQGNPNPYVTPKLEMDGAYSRVCHARGIPSIHLAKGASYATIDLARDKFVLREGLMRSATHVMYAHGQNDLANGVTLAQMQQQALRDVTKWRAEGRVVFGETIYPYVVNSPADWYLTAAGQTPVGGAYETARQGWNAWIKGQLTGAGLTAVGGDPTILVGAVFDDYLDSAAAVESTTNPGRFKSATTLRTGTATGGSGTTLVDSSATWTPRSLNGCMVKWTTGGVDYYGSVVSNTATTLYITVTSNVRASINGTYYDLGTTPPTPPGAGMAYTLYAPMTVDGLHANEYGKAAIASAFDALLAKWDLY